MSYILILIVLGVHTTAITQVKLKSKASCEKAKKTFLEDKSYDNELPYRQATCIEDGK